MGCQVRAGEHGINFTDGAWFFVHLCRPYLDDKQCYNLDGEMVAVNEAAVVAAHENVPLTYAEFCAWQESAGNVMYKMRNGLPVDERTFDEVRLFLLNAAVERHDVSVSY